MFVLWHEAYATFKKQVFFENVEMHLFLFKSFFTPQVTLAVFFFFFFLTGGNVPVILNKEKKTFLSLGLRKMKILVK